MSQNNCDCIKTLKHSLTDITLFNDFFKSTFCIYFRNVQVTCKELNKGRIGELYMYLSFNLNVFSLTVRK